ncbi:putative DNA helicase [Helianthus anomalus]
MHDYATVQAFPDCSAYQPGRCPEFTCELPTLTPFEALYGRKPPNIASYFIVLVFYCYEQGLNAILAIALKFAQLHQPTTILILLLEEKLLWGALLTVTFAFILSNRVTILYRFCPYFNALLGYKLISVLAETLQLHRTFELNKLLSLFVNFTSVAWLELALELLVIQCEHISLSLGDILSFNDASAKVFLLLGCVEDKKGLTRCDTCVTP